MFDEMDFSLQRIAQDWLEFVYAWRFDAGAGILLAAGQGLVTAEGGQDVPQRPGLLPGIVVEFFTGLLGGSLAHLEQVGQEGRQEVDKLVGQARKYADLTKS